MSEKIPFIQVDTSGAPAVSAVEDGEALSGTDTGLVVLGKDGSGNAQMIKTGTDGAVAVTDNGGSLTVDDGGSSITVDGSVSVSNFPATQPVSIATAVPVTDNGGSLTVDGSVSVSNFPATQPVSAASLPLPSGAATAAKQPALGTAGTPSTDVITVQGIASGTALKVDGSAVTQPVSDGGGSITVDGTVAISGGSITATDASNGSTGSAVPATASYTGFSDGTNLRGARVFDTDSGAGTEYTQGVVLRKSASGGSVEAGTSSDPIRVDPTGTTTQPVSDGGGSLTVDGSVSITGTPNVAVTSSALPSGAATSAKQPALGTAGTASSDVLTVQGIASMTALKVDGSGVTQPVSGTVTVTGVALDATLTGGTQTTRITDGTRTANVKAASTAAVAADPALVVAISPNNSVAATQSGGWTMNQGTGASASNRWPVQLTDGTSLMTLKAASTAAVATDPAVVVAVSPNNSVAITAASLPLPSGAATAAKQPALGTAGSASTDVITVQGITSMTALKVDGSAVTQPVSGTITANIGTSGSLALDATLTGGTQKAITRGGAKGTTTATDVTSTASGANHQPLDVAIYDASGNQLGTSSNPLRVDTTNNTAQAVTGTVTVTGTIVANADISGTGLSLNALGIAPTVALSGRHGAAVFIASGTLAGTVVPEISFDNGTTWVSTYFVDPSTEAKATSLVFTNPNSAVSRVLAVGSGATNARVRVSSFTSGAASGTLRATTIVNPPRLETGATASPVPPNALQVAGSDGTNLVALKTASDGTVRVDPTGVTTQPVSGTLKITDGTNTAAVKSASAIATASDPALVVALSPNSSDAAKGQASFTSTTTTNVPIIGQSYNVFRAYLSGTFTNITLSVQGSTDNVNWNTLVGYSSSGASLASVNTTNTMVTYLISGYSYLRFSTSVASPTGTMVVDYTLSRSAQFGLGTSSLPYTAIMDANGFLMPAGASAGNGIFIKMTDGSNTATIKNASTPAAASDLALVVVQSPNEAGLTAAASSNNAVSTSSIQVLGNNASRAAAVFQNIGSVDVYLYCHASNAATTTNFTIKIAPNGYYELLIHPKKGCYQGPIKAITASGSTTLEVQEYT